MSALDKLKVIKASHENFAENFRSTLPKGATYGVVKFCRDQAERLGEAMLELETEEKRVDDRFRHEPLDCGLRLRGARFPAANCPQCGGKLQEVLQSASSLLNEEQFDANKAGDYFCTKCPSNGRSHTPYAYFWRRETENATRVEAPAPRPAPQPLPQKETP